VVLPGSATMPITLPTFPISFCLQSDSNAAPRRGKGKRDEKRRRITFCLGGSGNGC
jgi:hypothetical protein